ncbi:MAG: hypothetical protein IJP64_04635 [Oscillospiraceae bacterium]|nr:hypothetical protein [Oscillospiraceae bacterium]
MLTPLVAMLIVALVAVAMLYLRLASREAPVAADPSAAPSAVPVAAVEAPAPTPEPTPKAPIQLYLDLPDHAEALDAVVCDEDGLAVPGYAFPLVIRCQDGSEYSVRSDVNGHYYAEYLLPGEYTVSMSAFEGFLPAESRKCTVTRRSGSTPVENIGSFVENDEDEETALSSEGRHDASREIEGLDAALPPDGGGDYRYRYAVGDNGFLLLADGTESDVLPVEERGNLVYGLRMVSVFHLLDGTVVLPEELPEGAVRWTDYYIDQKAVAVPLILGSGATDERYAITAEYDDPSLHRTGWTEENGRSYYYAADGRPLSGLNNIDGKLYFFDGNGAKASSLGIDVSYFNSAIDWNAVKAAGIDFAIVRVAYRTWEKGILNEDGDSYGQGKNGGFYLQGAKAAGLKVGVYVYSTAVNTDEAVEEAQLALEIVRKSGVELDMPIYFDTEFSTAARRGRADRLNYTQRAEIARAFCETVENAGFRAGVYANEDFFNRALRIQDVSDYDIWYASYTYGFALPYFRGFDIWQFSESVRVNGMPDNTDINVIF